MLKFDASIFGGELPVGLGVVGIAVVLPGGDFVDEGLLVGNAAIEALGRIFIGDDTTDEPVFDVIPKFGGLGFSVGRIVPGVDGYFDKPEDVRSWLARIVADRGGHAE